MDNNQYQTIFNNHDPWFIHHIFHMNDGFHNQPMIAAAEPR